MKYNWTNWKTIVGALFMYGGCKEVIATWNQFHSFAPGVVGSLVLTLIAVIVFITGMRTKKKNQTII